MFFVSPSLKILTIVGTMTVRLTDNNTLLPICYTYYIMYISRYLPILSTYITTHDQSTSLVILVGVESK